MSTPITLKWLAEQDACDEGVTWWESCGETDGAAVMRLLLAADFEDALPWANWLVARLLDRSNKLRYAIGAAESVLDHAGSSRPQAEAAIAAAKAVLAADGEEIRQTAARAASDASSAAADAADAAWAAWAAAWAAWAAARAASDASSDAASASDAAAWAAWASDAAWAERAQNHLRTLVEFGLGLLEGK